MGSQHRSTSNSFAYSNELTFTIKCKYYFKFVGETTSILNRYITSYITKAEKNATDELWEAMDHSLPLASRLRSFGRQNLKRREIGGYEAAAKILGHQYYFSSDAVQYVSTGMQQYRTRRIQSYADLEKLDSNSKKVNFRNMIDDYYKNRPKELETESLYTIHQWYEFDKNGSKTDRANYFKLHNNLGWLRKRIKPKVIKTTNYSTKTDDGIERYYHALLLLFKPWRDEADLLKDGDSTFPSYFAAFQAVSPQFEDMNKHHVAKTKIAAAKDLAKRLEEEAEEEASAAADDEVPVDFADQAVFQLLTTEELKNKVSSLNADQRDIFNVVYSAIEKQKSGEDEQVKMIISGVAGSETLMFFHLPWSIVLFFQCFI
jgi:hypothetical protein